MQSIVKQPLLWIGLCILIVALVIVSGRMNEEANTTAKPQQADSPGSVLSANALVVGNQQAVEQKKEAELANAVNSQVDIDDEMPRHQDMLSEEMKQAIRDQLILHGPKETFEKPDGTVVLPSEGRSTQVTVAVQMPDGTIQIREYSELPEDSKPSYKVSSKPLNKSLK